MKWDQIELIRSKKRKKTIEGKIIDTTLRIYLPDNLSTKDEKRYIKTITEKMEKKHLKKQLNSNTDLQNRAAKINKQYFNDQLDYSIQFVTNQQKKYGSCTPASKSIRISDQIADYPSFVQDYLIIHELAHLIHANHSKAFWELVHKYPYVERAKGFLYAVEYLSKK